MRDIPKFPAAEPAPQFGDLLLLVWRRKWILLLFTAVAAGIGAGFAFADRRVVFQKDFLMPNFSLLPKLPSLPMEFARTLVLPETEEKFVAMLPAYLREEAGKSGGLASIVSVTVDTNPPVMRVRSTSHDLNLTNVTAVFAKDLLIDFLIDVCQLEQEKFTGLIMVYEESMKERRLQMEEFRAGGDPDVVIEQVRSLLAVRETVLSETLQKETYDPAILEQRLRVIDDQLANIDMTGARSGKAVLDLYIEDYQKTVRNYLDQRRNRDFFDDARLSAAASRASIRPENIQTLPVQRSASVPQRAVLFGAFGFFAGVILVLLHHSLTDAVRRAESPGV